MNTNEAIIVSLLVLGTLWLALRNRAAATPTASGAVDLLEMMQPTPFDPKPVPAAAGGTGTPSDICRDYCSGKIVFFRDPGCNCQLTLNEGQRRIQI